MMFCAFFLLCQDLLRASFLLGKLMKRERLNCLVLSLYPDNEGFSLMIKGSDFEFETIKLPYEVWHSECAVIFNY